MLPSKLNSTQCPILLAPNANTGTYFTQLLTNFCKIFISSSKVNNTKLKAWLRCLYSPPLDPHGEGRRGSRLRAIMLDSITDICYHLTHLMTLSATLSAVFGMYICPWTTQQRNIIKPSEKITGIVKRSKKTSHNANYSKSISNCLIIIIIIIITPCLVSYPREFSTEGLKKIK